MKLTQKTTDAFIGEIVLFAVACIGAALIGGLYMAHIQDQRDTDWYQACVWVDRMNSPVARANMADSGATDINMTVAMDGAMISNAVFKEFLRRQPHSLGFYALNRFPPSSEPLVAVSDGHKVYPPLDAKWQLCNDFPDLKREGR